MYKLLIIGNAIDKHIERLICGLKKYNRDAQIDLLTFFQEEPSQELANCVNNFFFVNPRLCSINILNTLSRIKRLRTTIKTISLKTYYDVVNIHYPTYEFSFVTKLLKRMTKCLLLTPWGSDVYRIDDYKRKLISYLYKKADFVSGINNRFLKDVVRIYSIPDNKITELSMGSDTIDYIYAHKNEVKKEDAKRFLDINKDNYVITCGYNGGKGQNHLSIIDSIISVKGGLPKNITLVFPMTYGLSQDYYKEIKERINVGELNSMFFTEYLDLQSFFNIIKATDIFIHVQQTDNNSATLKEFVLGGANVINGSWLKYDDLYKSDNSPIWEIDDVSLVGDKIIDIIKLETKPLDKMIEGNILKMGYKYWIPRWNTFYVEQSKRKLRCGKH